MVKLVGINGRFTHSCLSIFYVREALQKELPDVDCELYQFTISDDPYKMVLRLAEGEPEIVMFSTYIWNGRLVERVGRDLLKLLPRVRIVLGGPQAEETWKDLASDRCGVVFGPIEEVDSGFWRDLRGKTVQGEYRAGEERLGAFACPYREEDFSSHLKNRAIYYESSRGCPFRCAYCLSAGRKRLVHLPLDQVEAELDRIIAHGPKIVRFVDRTFNDMPERCLAIWQYLIERDAGGKTVFHFEMAPDRFSEEMFRFLETVPAGKFQFEVGIQSTNRKTLDAIDRKMDLDLCRKNISRLRTMANIHLHLDLILGLPYETRESFAASFNDLFAMGGDHIQMGLLKVLPDTPLSRRLERYGMQHCGEPPYQVLATRWMDHGTLARLYWFSEGVEKFLNNRYFPSIWRYLREREDDMFRFFSVLLETGKDLGLYRLAPTQQLLTEIMVETVRTRSDGGFLLDLLRYDWLRSGIRHLPEFLRPPEEGSRLRSRLYDSMPRELEPLYTPAGRNSFFRKSAFLEVSGSVVRWLGFGAGGAKLHCLCFLVEKEASGSGFRRVVLLPDPGKT